MNRSEYAANNALRAAVTLRDHRAPEVIRRQRDAIARHDARKRRAARRETVARFVCLVVLPLAAVATFVNVT